MNISDKTLEMVTIPINNNHAFNTGNTQLAINYFGKELVYRVQEFRGLGIQMLHSSGSSRFGHFSVQGETPIPETISLSFIVDEEFKVFKDWFGLMQRYFNPETPEYKATGEYIEEYGQAHLRILNNNMDGTALSVRIHNIVLDALGEIYTTTLNDGSEVFTFSVILRYDYYKILDLEE